MTALQKFEVVISSKNILVVILSPQQGQLAIHEENFSSNFRIVYITDLRKICSYKQLNTLIQETKKHYVYTAILLYGFKIHFQSGPDLPYGRVLGAERLWGHHPWMVVVTETLRRSFIGRLLY